MSPQVCKNIPYTKKTDVYSLGVVFYRLMTFEYPFYAGNNTALKLRILAGDAPDIKTNYCEDLKKMVKWMLVVDENARANVDDLLKLDIFTDRLEHYGYMDDDMIETI